MNHSKFIIETSPNRSILEQLDAVNRATDNQQGISKSRLLLITISTTMAIAMKKPLAQEYYQWTRTYLETIKNEDGTSLPNISKFLKYIDWYQKHHNMEDILQSTRYSVPSDEKIEIVIQEPSEDVLQIPDTILSSTKVPKPQTQISQNEDIQLVLPQLNFIDADPEEKNENV